MDFERLLADRVRVLGRSERAGEGATVSTAVVCDDCGHEYPEDRDECPGL